MILPKGRRSLRSPAHKGKFIASIAQSLALSGCQTADVESRNGSPGGHTPCTTSATSRHVRKAASSHTMPVDAEVITAEPEVVVDPAVGREKAPRMTC